MSRKHDRRGERHPSSRDDRHHESPHLPPSPESDEAHRPIAFTLKPLTPAQDRHLKALKSQTCVFATGPAGTGKTFVAAAYSAQQLRDHEIDRIIITRPTVEAGSRGLGYLKGDLNDKFLVWTWPFLKGFHRTLGKSYYEYLRKAERIDICPLQFAQGMSFGGCGEKVIVLADEFENATLAEMKMLLTRVGEDTRIFLGGDVQQTMVRDSGYLQAIHLLRALPGIAHVTYDTCDIVRSEFTRRIVEAFEGVQYQEEVQGVFAPR